MYSRFFDKLQNSLVIIMLWLGNTHIQDRTDIALRLRIEYYANRK